MAAAVGPPRCSPPVEMQEELEGGMGEGGAGMDGTPHPTLPSFTDLPGREM